MGVARSRLLIAAGAGAIVLIVAGAVAVFGESATVSVVVPPQRIETVLSLDSISIQRIKAQLTDTWQGTSSTVPVTAAFASGSVRFTLTCPALPPCQPLTVPAGQVVRTSDSVRFATVAAVTLQPPAASQQATVGIKALTPGSTGNQGTGAIQWVDNSPRSCCLTVVNTSPTTGGADAGMGQVVQQSDLDAAKAALTTDVTNKLQAALTSQAAGLTYVPDTVPSLSFKADHKVGDKTATFNLTVTASLGARAFTNSVAESRLRAALQKAVHPGYKLVGPIQTSYTFGPGSDPNHPSLSGDAVAYAVPAAGSTQVAGELKGMSTQDAYSHLQGEFPGAAAHIVVGGFSLFGRLPYFPNRIAVSVSVRPAPPS